MSSYSPDFTDPTPAEFEDVKATHSVLMSAAFFIQDHCRDYNDDFMLCKRDNGDPAKCAAEGRKVTRCVLDLYLIQDLLIARFSKLKLNCEDSFDNHWKCLEVNNNYYWKCRDQEQVFNQCVFQRMVRETLVFDT